MKTKAFIVALGLICVCVPRMQAEISTAFTYQGRLNAGGSPANGIYDLRFTIYDSSGGIVAGPITNSATSVSNGLFTAVLDFGASAFPGADRWLEIAVRETGSTNNFSR